MQAKTSNNTRTYTLRDFTRMVIAFFCSLMVLGIYQQLRLYAQGVLDQVAGKSLLLLMMHQLGFAALIAIPLAFLYNTLERKRSSLGFKWVRFLLLLSLIIEGILIEFYVTNFEILGQGFVNVYSSLTSFAEFVLAIGMLAPICLGSYYLFYRLSSSTYKIIGRMYPFTIILFSLFLATLYSDKKPINENKTQHLLVDNAIYLLDWDKYEGEEEYPLLATYEPSEELSPFFDLQEQPPNIVFVVIDGLGSDLTGPNAPYNGFTPYLNSLLSESLYWPNHLSNTGEAHASLPTILGSLPFGKEGFNRAASRVNRNTILGTLKKNGYVTSFNYGGNSALFQWDKFLFEDRIDFMLDVKGFGSDYIKQEKDAAGISLGFPDKELFRKWKDEHEATSSPFLDVFFTLSSRKPFLIPQQDEYIEKVEKISDAQGFERSIAKNINKNKEVFASILYADEALEQFIENFKKLPEYHNTIFVITGSHNMAELPRLDPLSRYRVPLIIHSALISQNKTFNGLVSHADITPALLGLLKTPYSLDIPEKVSYIGNGLITQSFSDPSRQIPLFRHESNIKDFISGKYFLSDGYLYDIGEDLSLLDSEDSERAALVKQEFKSFKAVNKYVVNENRLIPDELALFAQTAKEPNKQELIWINSVFNGSDFDNAYETARSLALEGDRERALLLCSYILNRVPGHADTEILMGRIYAWQGDYERAAEILEVSILKYPVYTDAYAALLDVYFWSEKNEKAVLLRKQIERNNLKSQELQKKLKRAMDAIGNEAPLTGQKIRFQDLEKQETMANNHFE